MTQAQFKFRHTLRVRYSEVDAQAVVFNAHYLTYYDVAHTEYLRHLSQLYPRLNFQEAVDCQLVKSSVEYKRPIRWDQQLDVWVRTVRIGTTSFTAEFEIHPSDDDELLARGEIVYVSVDPETQSSRPVPGELVSAFRSFEPHLA